MLIFKVPYFNYFSVLELKSISSRRSANFALFILLIFKKAFNRITALTANSARCQKSIVFSRALRTAWGAVFIQTAVSPTARISQLW